MTKLTQLFSEDEFLSKAAEVPLQKLNWHMAAQQGVEIWIRRDDLIHAQISGNKFYKLFYNLQHAQQTGYKTLLSFGGAYSNHLYALAAAGHQFGFRTLGVIRGERPAYLSSTLQDAERWGMQLHFISRADYVSESKHLSPILHNHLRQVYGDFFEIPEGGCNQYGLRGTRVLGRALHEQLKGDYTSVCLASGTANTLAGIALGIASASCTHQSAGNVIGFSVLKGEGNLGAGVISQQREFACADHSLNNHTDIFHRWRLINGFHGGGYGKKLPPYLVNFNRQFEQETGVLLDPVYTLKMCWGVSQLLLQGYWPRGSRLVLVHTGGLQGRRGFAL